MYNGRNLITKLSVEVMKMMVKAFLGLIAIVSLSVSAKPWMPWDNDNRSYDNDNFFESWMPWNDGNDGYGQGSGLSNWGPFDGGTNWGPFDSGSDWGPFDGASKWGPFSSDSKWGPFNSENNWGPISNMNDMVNESDWGFYYNNKNTTSNKGYARADGEYAADLLNRLSGQGEGYTRGNAESYYQGQLEGYGKGRGEGRYEGYGQKGHFGYPPAKGNDFPAPAY